MKASEEIAADMFIKDCMRNGIDSRHEIVRKAKQIDGVDSQKIGELLDSGKSQPYESSMPNNKCSECSSQMMFDEVKDEFYCPACES